jgi:hypothetical protein
MKALFSIAVSALMAGGLFAAEALKPAAVADFKGWVKNIKPIENGVRLSGTYSSMRIETIKTIKVDTKKKYRISCEYRIAPGAKSAARFYFAPVCIGKDGKVLAATPQNAYPGTQTVLAAAAKKGDKVVKIKDGAKWVEQWGNIAFNAKADLSDLPNFDYVPFSAVKKNGSVWEVTLKSPLTKDYPAGTAVREQRDGASYRYMIAYQLPKAEWTKCSRVLTGEKPEAARGYESAWRLGTVASGMIIFTNGTPADIEFRNISLVEEK